MPELNSSTSHHKTTPDRMSKLVVGLEEAFFYRKLNIPYDLPGENARFSTPAAQDIKQGKPNSMGWGSGMAESLASLTMYIDGLILRLELGIAGKTEEYILDSALTGYLRLATASTRIGGIVRGLAADGKSYFVHSEPELQAFFVYGLYRCLSCSVISRENQDKLRQAALKWLGRLERDNYRCISADNNPFPNSDLLATNSTDQPILAAILCFAHYLTKDQTYLDLLVKTIPDIEKAATQAKITKNSVIPPYRALALTLSLYLASILETDLRQIAWQTAAAVLVNNLLPNLEKFIPQTLPPPHSKPGKQYQGMTAASEANWRKTDLSLTNLRAEFVVPKAWTRLKRERETTFPALVAALSVLLNSDQFVLDDAAPGLQQLRQGIVWDKLNWSLVALSGPLFLALGTERGLWEQELLERPVTCLVDTLPSAAIYLTDDYDKLNPGRAGHIKKPNKPPKPEEVLPSVLSVEKAADAVPERSKGNSRSERQSSRHSSSKRQTLTDTQAAENKAVSGKSGQSKAVVTDNPVEQNDKTESPSRQERARHYTERKYKAEEKTDRQSQERTNTNREHVSSGDAIPKKTAAVKTVEPVKDNSVASAKGNRAAKAQSNNKTTDSVASAAATPAPNTVEKREKPHAKTSHKPKNQHRKRK